MAKKSKSATPQPEVFATNRKARHHYDILETYEAGIELRGAEIKSIRQHRASLDGSFARFEDGELILYNMHVSAYEQAGRFNVDPVRQRKLLMHRREINRLRGIIAQKRATLVPLKLYQKRGLAKIELAVARGKRVFEKRDRIRERELDRDLRRRVREQHMKGRGGD